MTVIAWIGLAASILIAIGITIGLMKLQRRLLGEEPDARPERLEADEPPRRLKAQG